MGFAELLRNNEPGTGPTGPITRGIQNKQRMRPCFTIATHPRKLLRPAQPFGARQGHGLPVSALHLAVLVAHRQLPTAFVATVFQYRTAIFRGHPRQKAVLTAARDAFWVPGQAHARCLQLCSAQGLKCRRRLHTKSAELAPRPSTGMLPVPDIIRRAGEHCQIMRRFWWPQICSTTQRLLDEGGTAQYYIYDPSPGGWEIIRSSDYDAGI